MSTAYLYLQRIATIIALFSLACSVTHSQSLQWKPTQGPYGTSTDALLELSSGKFLAGAYLLGVYQTISSPTHWTKLWQPDPLKFILKLVEAPNGDIYVGTSNGAYRSTDMGNQWQQLSREFSTSTKKETSILYGGLEISEIAIDHSGILFVDYKGLHRSTNSGNSWEHVPLFNDADGVTAAAIVIDSSSGIIAGFAGQPGSTSKYGGIFRSTDHGLTWTEISKKLGHIHVNTMEVLPSGTLLVGLGLSNRYDSTVHGIYRSTDLGNTWYQSGLLDQHVTLIIAPSNDMLLASTDSSTFRSTDQGSSWLPILKTIPIKTAAVHNNELYVGGNHYGIMSSSDGGKRWRFQNDGLPSAMYNSVLTGPDGELYVDDLFHRVWHSTDEGITWNQTSSQLLSENLALPVKLHSVDYSGTLIAYIEETSPQQFVRSTDGGLTWSPLTIPSTSLSSLNFEFDSDNNYYLALNYYGQILRSTDQGITWSSLKIETSEKIERVHVLVSGTILAVSSKTAWRSTDKGLNWSKVDLPAGINLVNRIVASNDGASLMPYGNSMLLSLNDGQTWELIQTPSVGMNMFAVGPNGEWIISNLPPRGKLYVSRDRGATIQVLDSSTILFGGIILAVGSHGTLLISSEYGPHYATLFPASISSTIRVSAQFTTSIQPNPSSEQLVVGVTLPREGHVSVELLNMTGECVKEIVSNELSTGKHFIAFNVEDLPNGSYYCQTRLDELKDVKLVTITR